MNNKLCELRKFLITGFLILVAMPGLTFAQVPAAVEGPITYITPATDGNGIDVTVMGVIVKVTPLAVTKPAIVSKTGANPVESGSRSTAQ